LENSGIIFGIIIAALIIISLAGVRFGLFEFKIGGTIMVVSLVEINFIVIK